MANINKTTLDAVDLVLKDIFSTENLRKIKSDIQESTSGTPIAASSVLASKDRTKLEDLFYKLRDIIDPKEFGMEFLQNRIDIFLNRGVYTGTDYTPNQTPIGEGFSNGDAFEYTPYIKSLLDYMIERGAEIEPLPTIEMIDDISQSDGIFCKTAYYSPNKKEIVLYTSGRHPKDILRSLAHEMIHHIQNLQGRIENRNINTTNTNEDSNLQELEDEAYLLGNRYFRNWEDMEKNKK